MLFLVFILSPLEIKIFIVRVFVILDLMVQNEIKKFA